MREPPGKVQASFMTRAFGGKAALCYQPGGFSRFAPYNSSLPVSLVAAYVTIIPS